jgi:putative transposase
MPYWRLFYHLVWATRDREPMLVGETARLVERSLRATCEELKALIHALFVMPDHVHLAVSIPPSVSVATMVSRLKGSSSHLVNHATGGMAGGFAWQAEYGALSFGEKQLPHVVAYVENQPERHGSRRVWEKLELATEQT